MNGNDLLMKSDRYDRYSDGDYWSVTVRYKSGKRKRKENSKGGLELYDFDDNIIFSKHPDGYYEKIEYNEDSTVYRDSNGIERYYNEKGYMTKFVSHKFGFIKEYEYNDAGECIKTSRKTLDYSTYKPRFLPGCSCWS